MSYKSIVFVLFFVAKVLIAQISGTIKNKYDGQPILGVNIIVDGNGTSTDRYGQFSIDVPIGASIEFSHMGYEKITLKAEKFMDVLLETKPINFEKIVVYSGLNDGPLQDWTQGISVITSDEIRKSSADHFQTLIDQIPNLTWAGGTSRPRYFQIRGIGERSHYFGEGAPNFSVGFMLDDIDLSGLGMVAHLFDLKQIEIFKGPQSSVFGSNAIAGLISLRSKEPKDNSEQQYLFSIGTDNHSSISNAFNLKLGKGLGIRFSGNYFYTDGFRNNVLKNINDSNKKEERLLRMKLKYKFSNNTTLLSTLIYANMANGYDVWAPDNNIDYQTYSNDDGEDSQKTIGGSLRLNMALSDLIRMTSITSFSKTDLVHAYDGDWANDGYWYEKYGFDSEIEGWSYNFYDKNIRDRKNFTQEVRIAINEVIFGIFYKDMEEKDQANGYLFGGLATDAYGQYDFKVTSSYFQVSHDLSSRIKFSTNFRIEKNIIGYEGTAIGLDDYWEQVELPRVNYETDDIMMGYRSSLVYKKSNTLSFISSIAKGYKSGGVNQQPYLNDLSRSYGPEALLNTEIGLKYHSNNVQTNMTCFYGARREQQVSISSQQIGGDPNSFIYYTSNAGSGIIKGIELENRFKLSPNIVLDASCAYLDTWVGSFNYFAAEGLAISGGNRKAAMSPKFSGSLNLAFENDRGIYGSINANYKSAYYYSDSHNERSNSYFLTNFSLSNPISETLVMTIWVRNIFDHRYANRGFYFGLIPPDYPNELFESYADPRQIGLSLNYEI